MADPSAPPRSVLALAPSLGTPGYRLVDAGELQVLLSSFFGSMSGIVATGTDKATAYQLKVGTNEIVTAPAGSGVVLPGSLPGMRVTIVNSSAGAVIVYGKGADQIMASASVTLTPSVTQATLLAAEYICISLGVWRQTLEYVAPVVP